MRTLVLIAMLTVCGSAHAQQAPHDFTQDTPPVPGQIVERPRERLRIAPLPLRTDRSSNLGLPSSGPKGTLRESFNEPEFAPPTDR
jgi:hypothetical protein